MFAEVADVVLRAMDEARFAPAHEVEAQHVQARCVDDSAVVAQASFAIEHRHVQPAKSGRKPVAQRIVPMRPVVRSSVSGGWAATRVGANCSAESADHRRAPRRMVDVRDPAVDESSRRRSLRSAIAQWLRSEPENSALPLDSYEAANQRDAAFGQRIEVERRTVGLPTAAARVRGAHG